MESSLSFSKLYEEDFCWRPKLDDLDFLTLHE